MYAVATDHELATEAAVKMLRGGGNAFDAAVAAAAVLSVVDPYMSGLGGFGVALLSHQGKIRGLNFIGTAPRRLKLEELTMEDPWEDYKPSAEGPLSYLVPGSVAGWGEISKLGRLSWEKVMEPAVEAAHAHVVTQRIWKFYEGIKDRAAKHQTNYRTFYESGRFPMPGEVLRQPELERTLRLLAEEGWTSMYAGTLAQKLAESVKSQGGVMDEEDLKSFSVKWLDPINVELMGHEVYSLPQGTGGVSVLECSTSSGS